MFDNIETEMIVLGVRRLDSGLGLGCTSNRTPLVVRFEKVSESGG